VLPNTSDIRVNKFATGSDISLVR